jgi:hypothetical protein
VKDIDVTFRHDKPLTNRGRPGEVIVTTIINGFIIGDQWFSSIGAAEFFEELLRFMFERSFDKLDRIKRYALSIGEDPEDMCSNDTHARHLLLLLEDTHEKDR